MNNTELVNTPENYTVNYGKINTIIPVPKDPGAVQRYRKDAKKLLAIMQEKMNVDATGETMLLFFLAELILDGNTHET